MEDKGLLISITMPAYNEEQNIEATVKRCREVLDAEGLAGEIVVANDGSTDGTGRILEGLAATIPGLRVVTLAENSGYGSAMRAAIRAARGRFVVTTDSDGQFDMGDLPRLLAKIREGYDAVTGFRGEKKDSWAKVFGDKVHRRMTRVLTGIRYRDPQCALKIFDRETLFGLHLEARGYTFPTEALVKLDHGGGRTAEVEVSHLFREGGRSALNFFQTALKMSLFLFYLRFRRTLCRRGIIDHF